MNKISRLVAAILLILPPAASALVVKEAGEYSLNQNTTLVVTVVESPAVEGHSAPWFNYQLRRTNAGGEVLLTEPFFTAVHAGETMVIFWDDAKKVVWIGTKKFVSSWPETALQNGKYPFVNATDRLPTTWDRTGNWRHGEFSPQMPYGGVPEPLLKEGRQIFGQ